MRIQSTIPAQSKAALRVAPPRNQGRGKPEEPKDQPSLEAAYYLTQLSGGLGFLGAGLGAAAALSSGTLGIGLGGLTALPVSLAFGALGYMDAKDLFTKREPLSKKAMRAVGIGVAGVTVASSLYLGSQLGQAQFNPIGGALAGVVGAVSWTAGGLVGLPALWSSFSDSKMTHPENGLPLRMPDS